MQNIKKILRSALEKIIFNIQLKFQVNQLKSVWVMSPADKLQLTAALIERARCGPRGVTLEFKNRVLRAGLATRVPTEHARRRTCPLFAASSRLSFLAPRFTYPLHIALSHNDRVQQTQLLQTQLDDLEAYTNSCERSRIHSATVESAERDHCGRVLYGGDKWSEGPERKDGKKQRRGGMFFSSHAPWAPAWPGLT